nr:hypothetical protein [Saccharomycopsis fibuligera]WOF72331.1 hypothetical protein [Saccharomycopsis fibuligera]WOF72345.1 hypothetical protein [Saccharomycopsis fibuligera]
MLNQKVINDCHYIVNKKLSWKQAKDEFNIIFDKVYIRYIIYLYDYNTMLEITLR